MKLIIRFIFVIIAIFFIDITVYAYTAYKVGDEITYNGINYYVIKDSDSKDDSVTMLKAEPLTVAEVNQFGGVETANNHVNMYVTTNTSADYYQTAYNVNNSGYGGMAYYSSSTCGSSGSSGCTTDYAQSEIKYVVDAWKTAQAPNATNARLITLDDLTDNLGMELNKTNPTTYQITVTEDTPTWVMGENYYYWTMTTNTDKTADVWYVSNRSTARVDSNYVQSRNYAVRPVITLSKTALGDTDESIVDNTDNDDKGDNIQSENKSSDDKKETTTKVKVENTYMRQTLIIMIIGFISICSGVVIFYIIKNKKIISRR